MPGSPLPAIVTLPHIGETMHINRLVAMTGMRFINESSLKQASAQAQAAPAVHPPAQQSDDEAAAAADSDTEAMELSALQRQALQHLVAIMRGKAPARLSLEAAVALLEAACFYMAHEIVGHLPQFFQPLFKSADVHYVRSGSIVRVSSS